MNVTLCGKGDFVNVIKLRVLRWEDYPGLSRWAQCNHKCPYTREAGVAEKDDESRAWSHGATGQGMQAALKA